MEKLTFTEKFKKEDWEPLYGKWFYKTFENIGTTPNYWEIYKVTQTELGFAIYRLISNGCESESFVTYYNEYKSTDVPYGAYLFVDSFTSGQLRPLDESKVGDVKNLMAELEEANKSVESSNAAFIDSRKNIFERFLSLVQ